jgi:hypothetical protein
MALTIHPHNSELINHILAAGALITEHAVEIVEDYFDGDMLSKANIPSGMAAIFSTAVQKNVSDAAQSIYQRLSAQFTSIASSRVEIGSMSQEEPEAGEDIVRLEEQFLQASQHGVYKTMASLISTLRNVGHNEMESTLAFGLGLALQNNHENVARLLLESEVSPNLVNADGDSPAHIKYVWAYRRQYCDSECQ